MRKIYKAEKKVVVEAIKKCNRQIKGLEEDYKLCAQYDEWSINNLAAHFSNLQEKIYYNQDRIEDITQCSCVPEAVPLGQVLCFLGTFGVGLTLMITSPLVASNNTFWPNVQSMIMPLGMGVGGACIGAVVLQLTHIPEVVYRAKVVNKLNKEKNIVAYVLEKKENKVSIKTEIIEEIKALQLQKQNKQKALKGFKQALRKPYIEVCKDQ